MKNKKVIFATVLVAVILVGFLAIYYVEKNNNSGSWSKSSSTMTSVTEIDLDSSDQKINWSKYTTKEITLTESLTITQAGVYSLTGTIQDGCITVNTDGDVKLILDNVTIKNSKGPAIYVESAETVIISTAEGTQNKLEDGTTYSGYDEDVEGAIYSKDDLVLEGSGTLTVTGNKGDAIVGKDDLKINSGTYVITSADDGIRGKDSVYILDGNFTINAKADAIKSTNDTDTSKGYVKIENGTFNISAGDDAIHAETQLIIDNGNINISKSYEGLEGQYITINNGIINIVSSDDGINAAGGNDTSGMTGPSGMREDGKFFGSSNGTLTINGGTIYVNASGDGLDSNGAIYINGGTITVDGPTNNGNGALDYDSECIVKGGTVIAVGASGMAQGISNTSTQYGILVNFTSNYSSGTVVTLVDADNNEVMKYTAKKSFSSIAYSSSKLGKGTYTIKVNGETYQTVTISNISTTVGNTGMNGWNMNQRGGMNDGDIQQKGGMKQDMVNSGEGFNGGKIRKNN